MIQNLLGQARRLEGLRAAETGKGINFGILYGQRFPPVIHSANNTTSVHGDAKDPVKCLQFVLALAISKPLPLNIRLWPTHDMCMQIMSTLAISLRLDLRLGRCRSPGSVTPLKNISTAMSIASILNAYTRCSCKSSNHSSTAFH